MIGRKIWLFSKLSKGANDSAIIYSIIETVKANNLIVEKYLIYLFDMISKAYVHCKERLYKIMPWPADLPEKLKFQKLKINNNEYPSEP